MPFPVAGGVTNFDANGVIPEIWAGKMLVKFYEATVFGSIANTDYEGEIRNQGDVVHIKTTPDITISDYQKGQQLTHQQPQPNIVDLDIDKGKYWSFIAQDVDKAQADYNFISDWTADASSQMKIKIDADILTDVVADASAVNVGATAGKYSDFDMGTQAAPESITSANVLSYIVDMGTILDEQSVPEENRWIVAPPWFCGLIKKSDLKDASLAGDGTSIMRNGRIGMIDRFTIYRSNQCNVDTGVTHMIYGHKSAITFASQLTENEGPMRHPDYFGDYYRGLQVFGYDVIKPEAMGVLSCQKG